VSCTTRPVTQVAVVDVKIAVSGLVDSPERVAIGRRRRSDPKTIIEKYTATITCIGEVLPNFINLFFANAIFLPSVMRG